MWQTVLTRGNFIDQAASTMTWHPTQSHYLDTESTSHCLILIMLQAWLGSNKCQFLSHWFDSTRVSWFEFPQSAKIGNRRSTHSAIPSRCHGNWSFSEISRRAAVWQHYKATMCGERCRKSMFSLWTTSNIVRKVNLNQNNAGFTYSTRRCSIIYSQTVRLLIHTQIEQSDNLDWAVMDDGCWNFTSLELLRSYQDMTFDSVYSW